MKENGKTTRPMDRGRFVILTAVVIQGPLPTARDTDMGFLPFLTAVDMKGPGKMINLQGNKEIFI
jgi:hypothetical protein